MMSRLLLGFMNGFIAVGIGAFVAVGFYPLAVALAAFRVFQALDSIWLLILERR
ncbi:hypothetical protein [Herbaspirillum sp. ST 5-3]|uniref:hypothetical protein n=1 Tax=Oxalobacteraceae TaxID=75682 RepID=UPI0014562703|nr:hypothetical protein [Herbaspirillum sp. ST 5-3]